MIAKLSIFLFTFSLFICTSLAQADYVLAQFKQSKDAAKTWISSADSVMGGLSKVSLRQNDEGHIEISGNLSFENKGGFAGGDSPEFDCPDEGYDTVKVRFKGDGKCYRITILAGKYSAMAWTETVKGEWMELALPIEQFKPYSEPDASPPLTTTAGKKVKISVVIGAGKPKTKSDISYEALKEEQAGEFRIEVESISLANSKDTADR